MALLRRGFFVSKHRASWNPGSSKSRLTKLALNKVGNWSAFYFKKPDIILIFNYNLKQTSMRRLLAIIIAIIMLCIVFKIISFFFGATVGVLGVIAFVYFYPQIKKILA